MGEVIKEKHISAILIPFHRVTSIARLAIDFINFQNIESFKSSLTIYRLTGWMID